MKNSKVLFIFGTRPEVIKLAPLIRLLGQDSQRWTVKICCTGQHREMIQPLLKYFKIQVDYNLEVMVPGQTLSELTARLLTELPPVIKQLNPKLVIVQGDTASALAGALSSFYQQVPVAHIEAGLRSYDDYSPFPEEMNRRLISSLAELHFAPTAQNRQNLLNEGVSAETVFITGNPVIDALKQVYSEDYTFVNPDLDLIVSAAIKQQNFLAVMTIHRRENQTLRLGEIFQATIDICRRFPKLKIVFPVHLNPEIQKSAQEIFKSNSSVHLTKPLNYPDFVNLIGRSQLVLTDSGGLQEEAPALGTPVVVIRTETERPEAIAAGTAILAGVNREQICQVVSSIIEDPQLHRQMSQAVNPYGDGTASVQICKILNRY